MGSIANPGRDRVFLFQFCSAADGGFLSRPGGRHGIAACARNLARISRSESNSLYLESGCRSAACTKYSEKAVLRSFHRSHRRLLRTRRAYSSNLERLRRWGRSMGKDRRFFRGSTHAKRPGQGTNRNPRISELTLNISSVRVQPYALLPT